MEDNEIMQGDTVSQQKEAPQEQNSAPQNPSYEPFPGTVYSSTGKPVYIPTDDMRIPAQKSKQKKKNGSNRKLILYAVILVIVCMIVSSVSGAVSSIMVYKLMPSKSSQNENTENELTTDDVIFVTEPPVIVTEEENPPTEPATEEDTVFTTEPPVTVPVTEPPTTLPPVIKKTKSEIYNNAVNSVVGITSLYDRTFRTILGTYYTRQYGSTGSGFFISDDGYVVTNYHVVANGTDITVSTYDEQVYKARVVGYDDGNDIAVLKIDAPTRSVDLGSSDEALVGDDVMVIGNALTTLSYTFTDGVISYKNRRISTETNEQINMFQTNAAINSGNSGGPVYNMDGDVIGIASAKFASDQIEGLCFFIPIDDVKGKITEIIRSGA